MQNLKYGYIRVSTQEQNEDRQLIALEACGIPPKNLFIDKKSGKNFDRPKYQRMLKRLKKGDILYIKSIDRLGRNYDEIIEQWRFITRDIGADIVVLDMPLLDTRNYKDLLGTFISDIVLQILSLAAQLERDHLIQRTNEGLAAARAKGVILGRKPVVLPDNFEEIVQKWRSGELSVNEAAKLCGICVRTLYYKSDYIIKA